MKNIMSGKSLACICMLVMISLTLTACRQQEKIFYDRDLDGATVEQRGTWRTDVRVMTKRQVRLCGDIEGIVQLDSSGKVDPKIGSWITVSVEVEFVRGAWSDNPEMYGVMFNDSGPVAGAMSVDGIWDAARKEYWEVVKANIDALGYGRVPKGARPVFPLIE